MLAWTSQPDDRRSVKGRLFSPEGAPITDEFPLSDDQDQQTWQPAVGAQPDGAFVVTWARMDQNGLPIGLAARRFAASGSPMGHEFQVGDSDGRTDVEPSIDSDGAGRFVITWMRSNPAGGYDVCAKRFDVNGAPLTNTLVIAVANGGWKSGAAVAMADDGRFVISYNLEGKRQALEPSMRPVTPADVMARVYDADGRALGETFRVNRNNKGRQILSIASNVTRTAWSDLGQLAFVWTGHTGTDRRGVGLTMLLPADLNVPATTQPVPNAAVEIPAERVWGQDAQAPPVFDPNFVLEPPDQNVNPAGEDFGFLAIQSTGWNPPDPDLAVGPNNIVCVVNGQIAFFTKDGQNQFRQSIAGGGGFWGEVGATSFVFDPVALYDPLSDRFIVAAVEHSDFGEMVFNLAVSDDDDPNGVWHKYRFDVSWAGDFIDFPNLGVGPDAVYLTADFFAAPTGNFVFIIPKAPILVGDPVEIDGVRTSNGVRSLGSVKNYDLDAPAQYFATSFQGSSTQIALDAITDPLGEANRDTFLLTVPRISQPPDAEQRGSSNRVDTIDIRIKNGVYRNGSLWLAHTIGQDATARTRWYEIEMNGWPESQQEPTLRQSGTLDLGPGVHNWFADINVDAEGNMALAFNRSAADEFVSIQRTFRASDDPLGTVREPVTMQTSNSPEEGSRWGDYSGLEEDPVEPGVFWSHTEYRTSSWRTWVGRMDVAGSLPQLRFDFPSGLPASVDPNGTDAIRVEVLGQHNGVPLPGTGMLHYDDGDGFVAIPMEEIDDNVYDAVFPAIECGTAVPYFFSAETIDGELVTDPLDAPDTTHLVFSAQALPELFVDDFESDQGWVVQNTDLPDGAWERGVPVGGGDRGDPPTDFDGSGNCYLTDNEDGNSDVDGGPTRLIAPTVDLSSANDPYLAYARWFTVDDQDEDRLDVEISDDAGQSWILIESVPDSAGWVQQMVRIADYVQLTDMVTVRFSATDNPNDSITEAAIDAFAIFDLQCNATPAICIVHGDPDWDRNDSNTWTSFEDWAFSGYIDNKVESTDGVNRDLGLTQFDVVFSAEPFGDAAQGPVTAANVSVSVTGGAAPGVANVTKNGNVLTVELSGLMPLQEWTTFDFQLWNADGIEIADAGHEGEGVDECSRLDVGTLPSDVNNDGETQPLDLSREIASFSAGDPFTMLPDGHIRSGSIADYFDISRDGLFQPIDIGRVTAALNGSAPFTQNWNGVGMNSIRP